ncbi:MAG: alpha/beta fold hydrolase, partial [Anaerolineaceae bacterium]|nr:alpha/beta fold hydrolase [Anaerolineaceae bacterium]
MPVAGDLYYIESGRLTPENLTLLLIHGAGSSLLAFPAAMRRLNGYHVLAVDLPGHGRSPGYAVQSVTG